MPEKLTCCFTGNRPQKMDFGEDSEKWEILRQKIKSHIIDLIENMNVRHFISGLALGVDMTAAEEVIELMKYYPDITLEGASPCKNQSSRWKSYDRNRYKIIVAACDKFTLIGDEYTPYCMIQRNRYMVDNSDIVLAVWNGKPGGTANTINYARQKGKKLIILNTEE